VRLTFVVGPRARRPQPLPAPVRRLGQRPGPGPARSGRTPGLGAPFAL